MTSQWCCNRIHEHYIVFMYFLFTEIIMKKLFMTGLLVVAAIPVWAQTTDIAPEPTLVNTNELYECEKPLSSMEIKGLEKIISVLEKKSHTLDSVVWNNEFMQFLARSHRESVVSSLTYAKDMNENGECDSFIKDIDDAIEQVKEYVAALKELVKVSKELEVVHYKGKHVAADSALFALQKDVFGIIQSLGNNADTIGQLEEVTGKFEVNMYGNTLQGDISLDTTSNIDNMTKKLQAIFSLDSDVSGIVDGEEIDFNATLGMDVNIIEKTFYLGLKELSFSLIKGPAELKDLEKVIPVVRSVWANDYVTFDVENNPWSLAAIKAVENMLAFDVTLKAIMKEKISVIEFIHKEGNTYYGVINPDLCSIYDDWYARGECLYMHYQMTKDTNGKGFFSLRDEGNGKYSLGATTKFISKEVQKQIETDDMYLVLNESSITFDVNNGIQTAKIPLSSENDEYGIFLNNKELSFLYADEVAKIEWNGRLENDSINADIFFENFYEDFTIDAAITLTKTSSASYGMVFNFMLKQAGGGFVSIDLSSETFMQAYTPISKPTKTIDADTFSDKMDEALEKAWLN